MQRWWCLFACSGSLCWVCVQRGGALCVNSRESCTALDVSTCQHLAASCTVVVTGNSHPCPGTCAKRTADTPVFPPVLYLRYRPCACALFLPTRTSLLARLLLLCLCVPSWRTVPQHPGKPCHGVLGSTVTVASGPAQLVATIFTHSWPPLLLIRRICQRLRSCCG